MSAVEWLAEKYNYVTWLRNRDEIDAGTADKIRSEYLQQAKEFEKQEHYRTWREAIKSYDERGDVIRTISDFDYYWDKKIRE